jgi:hypothetical protein
MAISIRLKTSLAAVLISAVAAHAAGLPESMPESPPVLPNASADRFLGGVRDFGTGQPSPSIIYSTGGLAQATNSPEALKGPSVTSMGTPAPNVPIAGSQLQGGTLERRTNTPYSITPNQLERRTNSPYPLQSTWR